jgi:hypothetical protein
LFGLSLPALCLITAIAPRRVLRFPQFRNPTRAQISGSDPLKARFPTVLRVRPCGADLRFPRVRGFAEGFSAPSGHPTRPKVTETLCESPHHPESHHRESSRPVPTFGSTRKSAVEPIILFNFSGLNSPARACLWLLPRRPLPAKALTPRESSRSVCPWAVWEASEGPHKSPKQPARSIPVRSARKRVSRPKTSGPNTHPCACQRAQQCAAHSPHTIRPQTRLDVWNASNFSHMAMSALALAVLGCHQRGRGALFSTVTNDRRPQPPTYTPPVQPLCRRWWWW